MTNQDIFSKDSACASFPFTEGFRYVPINDQKQLADVVDDTVCGIMIELVQGEGGVIAMDKEYAQYIDKLCKENNILLIVDEVQTGIGRTGTFLCCEQYQIRPNIITLAKGLGGGLPIGAILMDEATKDTFQPGQHGSAFGGNPVVCAGGIEVLNQVCNEAFLSGVTAKAAYFKERLLTIPGVTSVPPLNITFEEIDRGINVLCKCLSEQANT